MELDIEDVDALAPAIRKLKRVIAAVPPMEDFLKQVCQFVLGGHSRSNAAGRMTIRPAELPASKLSEPHILQQVLDTLMDWQRGVTESSATKVHV